MCVNGSSIQMLCQKKLESYYYKKCVVSKFKRVGLFHNNAHTFKLAKNSESHATMFYKLGPCDSFFLFSEFLINPNIHFAHQRTVMLFKNRFRVFRRCTAGILLIRCKTNENQSIKQLNIQQSYVFLNLSLFKNQSFEYRSRNIQHQIAFGKLEQ